MTTPALPQPGDLIADKYRVERILGEGAMGVVVAARHIELDEIRAIKLMLPSALGDGGAERFLREARAAVRLKSPHVCRVIDTGRREDGLPYIIMEHLEGTDLETILQTRGTLPPAEAAEYILQACEGLAEAHAAGMVHRDIKPANLFITRGPKGEPFVKILDFGIVKIQTGTDDTKLTRRHEVMGTPMYMAPEQIRSLPNLDARVDIWALGVTLYRALSGRLPFQAASLSNVLIAITSGPPPLLDAALPFGLDAVVLRCLEKNPASRYASVAELSAALRPFSTASPPPSGNPSLSELAPLSPLMNPAGTTTAPAALAPRPGIQPATPQEPTSGWRVPVFGGIAFGIFVVGTALLINRWLSTPPSVPATTAATVITTASPEPPAPLPARSAPEPPPPVDSSPLPSASAPPATTAPTAPTGAPAAPPAKLTATPVGPRKPPARPSTGYGDERK